MRSQIVDGTFAHPPQSSDSGAYDYYYVCSGLDASYTNLKYTYMYVCASFTAAVV